MKRIVLLGSTGSIGKSALRVVAQFPERFKIVGLTAGRNTTLFREQIDQFSPSVVAVSEEQPYRRLKASLKGQRLISIRHGVEGISSVAQLEDADIVISAISGSAGLLPTLAAIRAGKTVALANKEALVMAGTIVISEAKRCGSVLVPVDSEHSAIFQCLRGDSRPSLRRLLLTASGGPFLGKTARELEQASPRDALRHPNWSMGEKITIDSATLMNKGLEVIEAHHLFSMPVEKIEVLIHPQSIIHSMVEFNDGSYIAQLSQPDMRGPIAYALSYPDRLPDVMDSISWEKLSGLTFRKPDNGTFPCLSLAYSAIERGGTLPAVLNASNEVAIEAFLRERIGFNDIPAIIRGVIEAHEVQPADDLATILEADRWAREKTREEVHNR